MIIDLILNRRDDEQLMAAGYQCVEYPNGKMRLLKYNAHDFYYKVLRYGGENAEHITRAMDYGTDADVKRELCAYITGCNYNPEICEYINSRNWIE